MSRIGRKPVAIPAGVEVSLDGQTLTVKGPKGTLTKTFHNRMNIAVENNEIVVTRPSDVKEDRSLHGLTRTLISNMVEGVTNGFKKELEINGVGYRASKEGKNLVMILGYSHKVIMPEIEGISIEVPGPNKIIVSGPDKQVVGQFAAKIREKRKPEPYKGKGIKYIDEKIGFFCYDYVDGMDSNLYMTSDSGKTFSKIILEPQELDSTALDAVSSGQSSSADNKLKWSDVYKEALVPVYGSDGTITVYLTQGAGGVYNNGKTAAMYQSTDKGTTFKYIGQYEINKNN